VKVLNETYYIDNIVLFLVWWSRRPIQIHSVPRWLGQHRLTYNSWSENQHIREVLWSWSSRSSLYPIFWCYDTPFLWWVKLRCHFLVRVFLVSFVCQQDYL